MTGRLERLEFHAVGTTCTVAVTSGPKARRALAAARDEVAACEQALSRFDPASDLSRLNAAGGAWLPVDRRLVEALRLALRARADTNGLFDPTVLPALAAAGYDRSFTELVERQPRVAAGWRAGSQIDLDEERSRARLAPGTAIDLGGIGKGYAAMRAVAAMRDVWPTLPGALADLGGDLALEGRSPDGGTWRIAVADPRRPGGTAGTLLLGSCGVATSGRDVRRFGPGRSLHHLIDPATGLPAEPGPLAVTVVAPSAAEAEAHATALGISSLAEATKHVERWPRISAVYVPHDGDPVPLGRPPLARPSRILVRAA